MAEKTAPSKVEEIKLASHHLRGSIPEQLSGGDDHFTEDNATLLKHHGTYQQDDRDVRGKDGKAYMFMVRSKIPGGRLTSDQLLAELDLGDELGNQTLRITTRQGLQLHGIRKNDLWKTIHRINEVQLSTLAACGDVQRNFMCCPAPHYQDSVHEEMHALAAKLADHFCPRTSAYHDIWVRDLATGEEHCAYNGSNGQANGHAHEVEPIYGPTYLPRKFKTAVGLPGDNCVDLYANDLGLMAICENWRIIGYNVLVGGGFGRTPSAKKTFPAVAKRMAFITPDQAIDVATAIVKVQRDHGNRSDRKIARMKYLINDWGLEKFKATVEDYYGAPLPDPHPQDVWGFDDHLGWHEQGDGRWYYGLNVENGRIKDEGEFRLKTALRKICGEFQPGIRLTSHQSILFTDIATENKDAIESILRAHGIKLSHEISAVRRWSMACVAWPTCGLSITEAERALPGIIDQLEVELAKLGLSQEVFTVRMTGCPNGCARPYNSDVGIVGKAAGKYTIFIGGRLLGDRLNFIYKDMVPEEDLVPTLVTLLVYFKQDRQENETFGDFCHRKGLEDLLAWSERFSPTPQPTAG
jgi:sulfite reductase (ferredoxin)